MSHRVTTPSHRLCQNTVHIGSTECIKYIHIGANNYHDYRPAWQAVFSVVYMSVTMASQHESSK